MGGIRTPETLLTFTRFPGVPLQPLEHHSLVCPGCLSWMASGVCGCFASAKLSVFFESPTMFGKVFFAPFSLWNIFRNKAPPTNVPVGRCCRRRVCFIGSLWRGLCVSAGGMCLYSRSGFLWPGEDEGVHKDVCGSGHGEPESGKDATVFGDKALNERKNASAANHGHK